MLPVNLLDKVSQSTLTSSILNPFLILLIITTISYCSQGSIQSLKVSFQKEKAPVNSLLVPHQQSNLENEVSF